MEEKRYEVISKKNPGLAAVLSALFPGSGFFYVGNYMKGFAYIFIFATLVVLEVQSAMYRSRVMELIIFGILIAGFYMFQIFDSYNEAQKTRRRIVKVEEAEAEEQVEPSQSSVSLFGSILILAIGVVFQLITLDVLDYGDLAKLWPLVLIAVGAKILFDYSKRKRGDEDEEH